MDKVIVYLSLSREELLAQLAEECSEAAGRTRRRCPRRTHFIS